VLRQEEVQEIETAAAAKPSLKVGCCSCRFHAAPTARRARQMVTGGELGVVYRLWFEAISRAWPVGAQLPPWRNDPARNGGGIAFDWGVYDLDWIAEVLGDGFRPRTVFGTLGNYFPLSEQRRPPTPDVDGRLAAEIVCDGGLTVHWERRAAEHGPPRHRVEIRGTRGGLDLSMTPEGKETRLLRHAYRVDEELSSETLPEEPADWRQTLRLSAPRYGGGDPRRPAPGFPAAPAACHPRRPRRALCLGCDPQRHHRRVTSRLR